MKLPWEPLFTIERSGRYEVTVSGIVSVLDGRGQTLLAVGDVDYQLWSRSCLKPWQLLGHYRFLKEAYPALKPQHLALMESSHNGERIHLDCLKEIMEIGGVDDSLLQCPAGLSMAPDTRSEEKKRGEKPRSLYNGCSGKHFGFLMAIKAAGGDMSDYLNPLADHFLPLRNVLAFLLGRSSNEFATTIDGCRLPNYALSAREIASLYCGLLRSDSAGGIENAPPAVRPLLDGLPEVGALMVRYPELIGGTDRLDTKLIKRELTDDQDVSLVAKEGAEGLLAVGLSASKAYPHGLGILIKVASGYEVRHFQIIIKALLEQLGLRTAPAEIDERNKHIKTEFHFRIPEYQRA